MKHLISVICLFIACFNPAVYSQINYGGKPYFPQQQSQLRNSGNYFIRMPSFDLDSVLLENKREENTGFRSYQFAHKFYTNINKKKDADLTIYPDGTKVWTIGIQSDGAYSLNFLLENIQIPEKGCFFIYSADYSHIIGKFDNRNISESGILPTRPVSGNKVIIEYSEPANAEFEGDFTLTEVNHDYLDVLRREPAGDRTEYFCMPDVLCEGVDETLIRSTVLLTVNGTSLCSGTLINNTKDDETPYLLTAMHCMNSSLQVPRPLEYYEDRAGTIIAFFQYNRSVCGSKIKGTEEMSLAITYPRLILEGNDLALLEFKERPPVYYNAYYAGWSLDKTGAYPPYTNLHHPRGAVKKYGSYANNIALATYGLFSPPFNKTSHWKIPAWSIGSTDAGSSGSPLFDRQNLIVGGLSGGASTCGSAGIDMFFSLGKAWEQENTMGNLKLFLDPKNKNVTEYAGFDPHKNNPLTRKGNANYINGDELISSKLSGAYSGYVFGNNNTNTVEFAEEFVVDKEKEVFGAYLFVPPMEYSNTLDISISVYSGSGSPEQLLCSTEFTPRYLKYNGSDFSWNDKTMDVATENFVLFDKPLKIKGKFFVSYRVKQSSGASFCVYNTQFANTGHSNTAWIKQNDENWIAASNYSISPLSTSLAIQLLYRSSGDGLGTENPSASELKAFYFDPISGIIYLTNEPKNSSSGYIRIFSLTGQLIEELNLNSGQTSYPVRKQPKGTIGIAKWADGTDAYSSKIVFF